MFEVYETTTGSALPDRATCLENTHATGIPVAPNPHSCEKSGVFENAVSESVDDVRQKITV
jgi:hypothetical protein